MTALGALFGLLLGKLLHAFVISKINIDMLAFDIRIVPMSFVCSILLTLLFACIVNVFMYYKIERINMAESLKSIE